MIGTIRAGLAAWRSGRLSMAAAFVVAVLAAGAAAAEDGYELWLRYPAMADDVRAAYAPHATEIVVPGDSDTLTAARAELARGLGGMLNAELPAADAADRDGAVLVGTPDTSPQIAALGWDLTGAGDEGYVLRAASVDGHAALVVAANTQVGALRGVFHLLRLFQTREDLDGLDVVSAPDVQLRLLNHWDNLNRYVERGYAGESIWDWHKLPDYVDPRYTDYARAAASVGINGASITNVNADATALTEPYLEKAAAVADVLRPYGIKVYLTARFSAPMEIGGLDTADPLDPDVAAWWEAKVDEIYTHIPDFGGFLVKANSEGQPGPQDYGRTHAEGANVMAAPLAGRGGVVMWRAFVYQSDNPEDRHKQAYDDFKPLDGQFLGNVLVQVKNGAIDFQPREPFHPMFGAMPQTPLMLEVQLTKEYLGFATHIAYLGTMWEEVLQSDTYAEGPGSTVAKVIDGELHDYPITGMAGVANIGSDRNWTGSHFDQANWHAFGRLSWNVDASAREIATDWARMTFTNDPSFVEPVVDMMMKSREAVVDYMTPLGLHHLMATGHHYGPGPWVDDLSRPEWNPVYYHRADAEGVGFDRTATGSDALAQYAPEVQAEWGDVDTIPETLLLWFHHAPWDHEMTSGRTLWDELVATYSRGVATVGEMRETWASVEDTIDPERAYQISGFLRIQEKEAKWWRDASIAYFQTFSKRPIPDGYDAPAQSLDYYMAIDHPYAPGETQPY